MKKGDILKGSFDQVLDQFEAAGHVPDDLRYQGASARTLQCHDGIRATLKRVKDGQWLVVSFKEEV